MYVSAAAKAVVFRSLPLTGEFVLMFGWNVNKTKKAKMRGASQAERNVCTAAEVKAGAECLDGEKGTGEGTEDAGQMFKSHE